MSDKNLIYEINLEELLDVAKEENDWEHWWTQFYTDELEFKAKSQIIASFIKTSSLNIVDKDTELKRVIRTMEDVRLVDALHQFSPLRDKTENVQSISWNAVREFSFFGYRCVVCQKYLELHRLDPTNFPSTTISEFIQFRVELSSSLRDKYSYICRPYDQKKFIRHYLQEQQFLYTSRVMGMLLFLISKTWLPTCKICKETIDHKSFSHQEQSMFPCCYPYRKIFGCNIGRLGREAFEEESQILEAFAKHLPVEGIPEMVVNMLDKKYCNAFELIDDWKAFQKWL